MPCWRSSDETLNESTAERHCRLFPKGSSIYDPPSISDCIFRHLQQYTSERRRRVQAMDRYEPWWMRVPDGCQIIGHRYLPLPTTQADTWYACRVTGRMARQIFRVCTHEHDSTPQMLAEDDLDVMQSFTAMKAKPMTQKFSC